MSELSSGKVSSVAPCNMHDKLDGNGVLSPYVSCSNEACHSLESVMALKNAYCVLRDRYNKLKLENLKLTKLMQKYNKIDPVNTPYGSLSNPVDDSVLVTSSTEIQPVSVTCELEQLRERLFRTSLEIQDDADADLRDSIMSIIPKLKDFELRLSGFTEPNQRSLAFPDASKMQSTSLGNRKCISSDIKSAEEAEEGIFPKPNDLLPEDLVAAGDYGDSLGLNELLVSDLREVLSSISTQSSDMGSACKLLKQQNDKLVHMKLRGIHRPSSPEPGFARDSADDGGWSLLTNPSHMRK